MALHLLCPHRQTGDAQEGGPVVGRGSLAAVKNCHLQREEGGGGKWRKLLDHLAGLRSLSGLSRTLYGFRCKGGAGLLSGLLLRERLLQGKLD